MNVDILYLPPEILQLIIRFKLTSNPKSGVFKKRKKKFATLRTTCSQFCNVMDSNAHLFVQELYNHCADVKLPIYISINFVNDSNKLYSLLKKMNTKNQVQNMEPGKKYKQTNLLHYFK